MLYQIIGASGSGKTELLLKSLGDSLKKGKKCYVIVPEQQSVAYEAMLCNRFGDGVNLLCEVLNFERLPNRIAREYGGLAVNHIDKGGACALLSLVCEELKDSLTEYAAVASDADFASSLYTLVSRMKMSCITPKMLNDTLEGGKLDDNERVKNKLHDIALIYQAYESHFGTELCDPRDSLTELASELKDKPFFSKCNVFIDGYYTFTEQEYLIIEEIIRQSNDTYISFTIDENRPFFKENKRAADRIKALSHGNCDVFYTDEPKRANFESLRYIERNIWKSKVERLSTDDGAVEMITARNRFDEVEAAAATILKYIRAGGRYRDISLITANTNSYLPIVDSVFSRAEIPVYLSAKESLAVKPLFSFILASISVVIEDFSLRSIKRYVKSGYTDLSVGESDVLLSYTSSWKLRGKAWYSDTEWTLDPEGYREGDLTPRGAKMLKIANEARNRVVAPLIALRETLLRKDITVSDALKALYRHLMDMQVSERILANAERLLKKGEREKSERELQLWKLLINIIDQLDGICGNKPITPKRLLALMKLMCDSYSLGAIPASLDSVTFGDASLIRAGGSKMVIILGVCDGEFPANTKHNGFFDDAEASVLEGIGLKLAETAVTQLNTNRFFVYAAFSAPTDKLVLLCPRSELAGGDLRPSSAWISVERMMPEDKEIIDFSAENAIYSRESVAANLPMLQKGTLRNDIENALTQAGVPYFEELPAVTDKKSRIEFEENLLNLSPSKFETYAKCPFSFFGNYLLNLKEKKQNEFSMPEIGNFVHKLLDLFMRECVKTGKFIAPEKSERKALIERLAEQYFLEVIGIQAKEDKRFLHTFNNMVKTIDFVAESLCNEFSESDFMPVGFEFKIGLKGEDIPAIEYDVEGKKVYLRGSIDRVDTYVQNGVKYVRVVDYKTYDKSFSADLVAYGLDSQLLHYLFAYCQKTNSKPAGALYYVVTLPNEQINGRESEEELKKLLEKTLKRTGIVINDVDIVCAMSHDLSFVPVKKKKGDILWHYGEAKRLYTDEEFDDLEDLLKKQINRLAGEIFGGNMDISPLEIENVKTEPCKYCAYGDLCRNKKQETDEEENDNADE